MFTIEYAYEERTEIENFNIGLNSTLYFNYHYSFRGNKPDCKIKEGKKQKSKTTRARDLQ